MIDKLLPRVVRSAVAYGDVPDEPPFPGEADLIANAVESRRRGFITARRCARQALGLPGLPANDARLEIDPQARTFTAHLLIAGDRLDGAPPLTALSGSYLVDR
ncbi:MAG TPA: hypothetical protein VGB74_18385, partial [Actinoplanes sp.]